MPHGEISVMILCLSIMGIYFSYRIVRAQAGTINIPTISSVFMLFYVVYVVIGATLLNVVYTQEEINRGFYARPEILLNLWIFSFAGLFLIPFGTYVADVIFKYNPRKTVSKVLSSKIHITHFDRSNLNFFIILSVASICVGAFAVFIMLSPDLPILVIFKGYTKSVLGQLRSGASVPHNWFFTLVMKKLALFLLLIVYFLKDSGFKWWVFFYFMLVFSMFVAVMDLQKAHLLNIFIVLTIAYIYKGSRINWRAVFLVAFIIWGSIVLMYALFMPRDELIIFPWHRIMVGQIYPFFWYFEYQELHGYVDVQLLPNPGRIFPFEPINIGTAIWMHAGHEELIKSGVVGSMPVVFFGAWFIGFGSGVAFLSMILFGIMMRTVDIYILRSLAMRKTVLLSALLLYFIYYFQWFTMTSFVGIFMDEKWILIVIVALFIRIAQLVLPQALKYYDGYSFVRVHRENETRD